MTQLDRIEKEVHELHQQMVDHRKETIEHMREIAILKTKMSIIGAISGISFTGLIGIITAIIIGGANA